MHRLVKESFDFVVRKGPSSVVLPGISFWETVSRAKRFGRVKDPQTGFGTTCCGITYLRPCREDTACRRPNSQRGLFP